MLLIWTEVRRSAVDGLGCFTLETVRRGTKVWTLHPAIDIRAALEDLEAMPMAAKRAWLRYGFVESDASRFAVLCGDDARFFNHSAVPNVGPIERDSESDYALVDIPAHVELLCDYRLLGPGLCRAWLDERKRL